MESVMLESSYDLELTPETNTKSYNICLLVMITCIMSYASVIEIAFPIPFGIVMLYVFKDFNMIAIKALMLSNVIMFVEVLFMFNMYFLGCWMLTSFYDVLYAKIVNEGNFQFGREDLFKMGAVTALPIGILGLMIIAPIFNQLPLLRVMSYDTILISFILVIVLTMVVSGIGYIHLFKGVKEIMKRMFDVDEIKIL